MATTFDPFRDLDRMFGGALRSPASSGMPMDLYRTGETFVAKVDLPGVDPSTVDVDVEDRTLTIRAERRPEPIAITTGTSNFSRAQVPWGLHIWTLPTGWQARPDRHDGAGAAVRWRWLATPPVPPGGSAVLAQPDPAAAAGRRYSVWSANFTLN